MLHVINLRDVSPVVVTTFTVTDCTRIANEETLRSTQLWRAGGLLTIHGGRWALRAEYGFSSFTARMVSPVDKGETRVTAMSQVAEAGLGLFL